MFVLPKFVGVARLDNTSVSIAKTLVQINGGATVVVIPLEITLTFSSVVSTAIRVRLSKRTTAGTATSFTVIRFSGAASAVSTAANNHTAEGTLGDVLYDDFINYLTNVPFRLPIPEGRVMLAPSERLALDFPSAPGAAVIVSATIQFAEIG